LINNSSKEKK